jgi:hypothetical protein
MRVYLITPLLLPTYNSIQVVEKSKVQQGGDENDKRKIVT